MQNLTTLVGTLFFLLSGFGLVAHAGSQRVEVFCSTVTNDGPEVQVIGILTPQQGVSGFFTIDDINNPDTTKTCKANPRSIAHDSWVMKTMVGKNKTGGTISGIGFESGKRPVKCKFKLDPVPESGAQAATIVWGESNFRVSCVNVTP